MGRGAKKVVLIVLALIVLAVIVAAIVLRPYFTMPDVDQDALHAKLTEWQAGVAEMENRPKADREALNNLLQQHRDFLRKDLDWKQECPPFDREAVQACSEEIEQAIADIDKRLEAILADGFVLQQSTDPEADFLPLAETMRTVKYELIAMMGEVEQKQYAPATDRWLRLADFNAGFAATPSLLYTMLNISMQKVMMPALDCIKADLPTDQLERIVARLEKWPDAEEQFIRSMQAETAIIVDLFGQEGSYQNVPGGSFLLWFADKSNFIERERMVLISLADRQLTDIENWRTSDRQGAPIDNTEYQDAFQYSLLVPIAWPNVVKLFEKVVDGEQLNKDLLTALRAELQSRKAEKP